MSARNSFRLFIKGGTKATNACQIKGGEDYSVIL